jgi:hypothetical protein
MELLRQTEKKYCSRAMIAAVLIAFLFIIAGHKPIGKGLVLGAIFSVINFVLIAETLPMKMGKSKNRTIGLSFASICFRYGLIAIPLFLGIKMARFDFFAVAVGIFFVQVMIVSDHFWNLILTWKNPKKIKE